MLAVIYSTYIFYSFIAFTLKNGNKKPSLVRLPRLPQSCYTCRVKATFPTFLKKSSLSAGNLIKVEWHPLVIYLHRHTIWP